MRTVREDLNALTEALIGAAIEVHRALGPGYPESFYGSALAIELEARQIAFERQAPVDVAYRGHVIGEGRIDLLVERVLVIELKSVLQMHPVFEAQALAYLKATDLRLALLINFNVPKLTDGIKRVIHGTV